MDNSEFLLSTLETSISNAHSIDLLSFLTSFVLGLAPVLLGLASVLPASALGYFRILFVFLTGATMVLLYWMIRRLVRHRRTRLTVLRKWQKEAFLAKDRLDSLAGERVTRMIELVQSMEDISVSRNPQYERFDQEFMSMLRE